MLIVTSSLIALSIADADVRRLVTRRFDEISGGRPTTTTATAS